MKKYDVIIIGGGVTGTSILYLLSKYTNIKSVALLEKYKEVATVSSNHTNNSQTLHYGDIETNYTKEKATKVKDAARLVAGYVEKNGNHLFKKTKKMVLAVGEKEVAELEQRFEDLQDIFPNLKKLQRNELAEIEPNLIKGRGSEKVLALCSEDGYAINFHALSKSFVKKALEEDKTVDVFLNQEVTKISKSDIYTVRTKDMKLQAKTIIVAAGAHSLIIAQELGYGNHFIILPGLGDFYKGKNLLQNKVYMMQIKKLPFAAVHGDPDVTDPSMTRFGPTTKVLPILERRNIKTFFDFLRVFHLRWNAIGSVVKILSDKDIFKFVMRSFLYDLPFIGKKIFVNLNVKKIIPSIKASDLEYGKGLGGLRPQLVDIKERKLLKGEVKVVGDNIIFNMTPSPGASVCLMNAETDTQTIMKFLGESYFFDKDRFRKDVG